MTGFCHAGCSGLDLNLDLVCPCATKSRLRSVGRGEGQPYSARPQVFTCNIITREFLPAT
jgi:hypothetical protein